MSTDVSNADDLKVTVCCSFAYSWLSGTNKQTPVC